MTRRKAPKPPGAMVLRREAILRALVALGDTMSPVIADAVGNPAIRGSIRSILSTLTNEGLVRVVGARPLRTGGNANVYQITPAGRQRLEGGPPPRRTPEAALDAYGVGRCALADIYGLSPR